jgi:hypothetical protein
VKYFVQCSPRTNRKRSDASRTGVSMRRGRFRPFASASVAMSSTSIFAAFSASSCAMKASENSLFAASPMRWLHASLQGLSGGMESAATIDLHRKPMRLEQVDADDADSVLSRLNRADWKEIGMCMDRLITR